MGCAITNAASASLPGKIGVPPTLPAVQVPQLCGLVFEGRQDVGAVLRQECEFDLGRGLV